MRILYTFQKRNGFWIVNCPCNKSITESNYNSLIEAINNFLANYENIKYFDIVIPSTVPTPIHFSKRIRLKRLPSTKKPKISHKFKYDSKWAIITPTFEKQNVLILHDPFRKPKKHILIYCDCDKIEQICGNTYNKDDLAQSLSYRNH